MHTCLFFFFAILIVYPTIWQHVVEEFEGMIWFWNLWTNTLWSALWRSLCSEMMDVVCEPGGERNWSGGIGTQAEYVGDSKLRQQPPYASRRAVTVPRPQDMASSSSTMRLLSLFPSPTQTTSSTGKTIGAPEAALWR